jgi:HAD superfamily hydrolase (TIGR01549 family)
VPAPQPPRYEAVLFDVLGTLVRLEPPWPLLRANLAARHAIEVSEEQAKEAIRAEMSYYIDHHAEGVDRPRLDDLRSRCAAVLGEHLPASAGQLTNDELTELLLDSLRFVPYPDAAPTLGRLRVAGVRAAVVSNWDCSLGAVLGELGLGGMLDAIVTSAQTGAKKPEATIFRAALEHLRCPPESAILVGDSLDTDVAGGRAARIRSVLLDRSGAAADRSGVETIVTLDNLPELMRAQPVL